MDCVYIAIVAGALLTIVAVLVSNVGIRKG